MSTYYVMSCVTCGQSTGNGINNGAAAMKAMVEHAAVLKLIEDACEGQGFSGNTGTFGEPLKFVVNHVGHHIQLKGEGGVLIDLGAPKKAKPDSK